MFLDRPQNSERIRAQFDLYLSDSTLTLKVSATAITEVVQNDIFGTQLPRLSGYPGGALVLPVPDAPTDISGLPVGNFGRNDAVIVNTAIHDELPLLTSNSRMPNQIFSNVMLRERFGTASFEIVQ